MTQTDPAAVPPLVEHLFRTEAARLVGVLTRLLGPAQLSLAEDVTQDALVAALHHWPRSGIPDNPSAWLLQVARRKALDALRREQSFESRAESLGAELDALAERRARAGEAALDSLFADDQLTMILLCCHPAISPDSRVALTLKTVGGFSVGEIARAFFAEESAIAQRLVRAKRALRDEQAPFAVPPAAELPARLGAVLDVLYLMFNEGYATHEGEALLRRDLCAEALRLAELLLTRSETAEPRVRALAALFCFHSSRLETRTDDDGALVRLADQDRTHWDRALITRGLLHFERSAAGEVLTTYHLEAEIAHCHALAASWSATDWPRILAAYDRLLAMTGSAVVALNRVVALREMHGADVARRELDGLAGIPELTRYHLYHGVRAELLDALGNREEAVRAYEEALGLARSAPVQGLIRRRLGEIGGGHVDSSAVRPSSG